MELTAGISRVDRVFPANRAWADFRDVILLQPGWLDSLGLAKSLAGEGWKAHISMDTREAIKCLRSSNIYVGIVLLDASFSEETQSELLEVINESASTEWIAIVDPGSMTSIEHASFLSAFFFDFHTTPVDIRRLAYSLGHAYGAAKLGEASRGELRLAINQRFGLIGSSKAMSLVYDDIEKISRSDEPVIVAGETGTGKELIARAIHGLSHRAEKPFIAVNCGAIPETLVQSEFFGHNKGAFTGAVEERIGHFEAATGGTVFLDGIENLPPLGQVSLLRFLQEKELTPLGSKESRPIDVRIIASASPRLRDAVATGLIREDLFYRLNVLQIDVPPLRNRGTDAAEIAEYFVDRFNRGKRRNAKRLSKKAIATLLDYPWPGNVRELMSCVNRAAVLSISRLITEMDLGLLRPARLNGKTLREIKAKAIEQAVILALAESKSITSAARRLGVSRVTLYRLMEKHSITVPGVEHVAG
ncbi:sigma-54 dependent transcriptional regulator [Methylocaldum sp.]|uniref:sigma-54-dependent transcriptional regulator n=1 Tax=Methylocaldum sp. TaxID=1969727 RepID=UPI002D2B666C|nr:sigma-54 dependent transcriptional regulator [Methylocaldum sp.]HYE35311.1 sigma-54 dependent transcriptional regulator [Methylocaldum sp.]